MSQQIPRTLEAPLPPLDFPVLGPTDVAMRAPLATESTPLCPAAHNRKLSILGTRGIPAHHGGFESFAEKLSQYLVERGWQVTVYCQESTGSRVTEDYWRGVRLVHVPVQRDDALGTVIFDWKSTRLAAREKGTILTLGYNTAVFSALYRLRRRTNLINMDGLEWQRKKWSRVQKAWLWLNERCAGCFANHVIADHPSIELHLMSRMPIRKITMIPYGADRIESADPALLAPYALTPERYALVVARPEPENSLLEIVRAFSRRTRGMRLVVLGRYEPEKNDYHRETMAAASDEVLFPGAIYDAAVVAALRVHARLYLHGHTVGGTNPALVEALGAGCAVLAHDNVFNRWVAGAEGAYFHDEDECARQLDLLAGDERQLARMRAASVRRFEEQFAWPKILRAYESLLKLKSAAL
jgi:glycosyltransferase involved in cell wall biosynthesis